MASVERSVVVADSVQVVHHALWLWIQRVVSLVNYEVRKVKSVNRKLHVVVQLAAAKHRPRRRKPLQVHYQNFWRFVNLHLLKSRNVVFALGAVPLV